MRTFIVQIRRRKRSEYPDTFLAQVSDEQARDLDEHVRRLFESGKIKDFLVKEVELSKILAYKDVSSYLRQIDLGLIKD